MGWFKTKRAKPLGQLGVEAGSHGVSLAQVHRQPAGLPRLLCCDHRDGHLADALKELVQAHRLEGSSVNFLLQPADYQIFLLEAPDVPPEELAAAMRWRVKDVISQPLEEVVIDSFALPADAYRGRTRMAYCVVLPKTRMAAIATAVTEAGLVLASIDIPEMAFRNLGLLAGADGINIALLQLRASEGLICVQNGADIYMARRIEQGVRAGQDMGGVALEIQRSLDYFESQLGKGYINRMFLLPTESDAEGTHQALASGMAINLLRLDLGELFDEHSEADLPPSLQARCLGAVGAALREAAR
ncbi:MSHA biogenesis protein MshI [Stutzerimonas urumqiensis]|uniref:type IV pilus biogenesis protein PilM n=1 Tax=Stutzerimonas urumqiensis TaxID=638269 RepID=UPI003BACA55D